VLSAWSDARSASSRTRFTHSNACVDELIAPVSSRLGADWGAIEADFTLSHPSVDVTELLRFRCISCYRGGAGSVYVRVFDEVCRHFTIIVGLC